jgi:hypothetical protein
MMTGFLAALVDGGGFVHEHLADGQALDLHAKNLGGELFGFLRVLGEFHPARLAASTDEHLRFNNNAATELFCDLSCFACGCRHPPLGDRDSVL